MSKKPHRYASSSHDATPIGFASGEYVGMGRQPIGCRPTGDSVDRVDLNENYSLLVIW